MKKSALTVSCFMLMSVLLSGCSGDNEEIKALKSELEQAKSQIESLKNTTQSSTKSTETDKTETQKQSYTVYTVYTANRNTYQKEIDAHVYLPANMEVKQKIQALADTLSKDRFEKYPIEVMKIEENDQKNIAVINLKDPVNGGENATWVQKHLQGSTGGSVTSVSLVETFLQKDSSGEWVDGVRFLYNGKPCDENQFQHAPALTKTQFR